MQPWGQQGSKSCNSVLEGFDDFTLGVKRATIAEALVKFIHKGT